jgi:hypothetical protein
MNIPDIATKVTYRAGKDQNPYYRVTGWYKAVPLTVPTGDGIADRVFREIFLESHPNWKHESRLVACVREEATHISIYGVCGAIVDLTNPDLECLQTYIQWSQERIEEERDNWINHTMALVNSGPTEIIKNGH